MLTDIAFGADGSLYALEYDSNGLLAPGSGGALWKVAADGSRSLVFSDGLVSPTGLAIGPGRLLCVELRLELGTRGRSC
jgi:hypothetical protein